MKVTGKRAAECRLVSRWGAVVLIALGLPFSGMMAQEPASGQTPFLTDEILVAARAGSVERIRALVNQSYEKNVRIGAEGAKQMLDNLLRGRELAAFTLLLDEMLQSSFGKDWQVDDAHLEQLVKDSRTDFLEVLLARRLKLDRLTRMADKADAKTAEWITKRVAEVRKQRADVDALVAASGKNELEEMRRLLDAGVDINGVSSDHWTPLTRAASKNQVDAVRLLLERGAEVDKVRHPGWDYTPLCLTKSVEIANLLKDAGANVHAKLFGRDVSILTYVARWGGADMVEWFLKQGVDPQKLGDNKQNLLFDAGDARTAELLLKAGLDPNHVDEFGRTPIMGAAKGVAQKLIEAGAKVTGFKEPILPQMIQLGSPDAIEAVLKAGAEHDPKMLQEALLRAAHMDQPETAEVLLKHGAKANEAVEYGAGLMLPLEACCIWGSAKTAKVLIEHGADPNTPVKAGSLLRNAMQNGYRDVAKILREAGVRGTSDLSYYIFQRDEAAIGQAIGSAPAYAEDTAFWDNVLPTAARIGDLQTVRAALAKGVPIRPDPKQDAYKAAAYEGQHEVLAALLKERKADDDVAELRPALWAAVWNSMPYEKQRRADAFEKSVRLLLDAGAPVGPTKEIRDDLIVAAVFTRNPGGNPRVLEMLVTAGADPNPKVSETEHLVDVVGQTCAQGGCGTPFLETVAALERLTKKPINREKKN